MILLIEQKLEGQNKAAYKVYGRSNSVFASNFLISRASHVLSTLDTPYLSQIFSTMIYNLVFGELIQARNYEDDETLKEAVESYISKTYYKTASLMSLACRGVGIIHNFDESKQRTAFDFGAHFGIAFQIADDILDFTQSSEELGKPAFNDLRSGLVTAPTIFAFSESKDKELEEMIKRKFQQDGDIDKTLEIINRTAGIGMLYHNNI
jgi:geranylgeranyl pyrophosphate synthase